MIDIRKFASLAHRDHGWLDTQFRFGFTITTIPTGWAGVGSAWNDDRIAPQVATAASAPRHGDRHFRADRRDHAQGFAGQHRPDRRRRRQVMSAGNGVVHAEYNLESEDTTLFQIWIMPDRAGGRR